MSRTLSLLFIATALSGCIEHHSEAYENVQRLGRDVRVEYARSLPLAQRFLLYEEYVAASGQPGDFILIDSFVDDGAETFPLIELRVAEGRGLSDYYALLGAINDDEGFSLCSGGERERAQRLFVGSGFDAGFAFAAWCGDAGDDAPQNISD